MRSMTICTCTRMWLPPNTAHQTMGLCLPNLTDDDLIAAGAARLPSGVWTMTNPEGNSK